MKIGYYCNRFPYLRIGKDIHFEGGLFETEDENLQQLIQSNDSFGRWIGFVDDPETILKRQQEEEAAKMQGGYKSDESHDATRQYADRIGMEEADKEALVQDKKEAVAEEHRKKLKPKPRYRRLDRARPKKTGSVDSEW